MTDDVIERELRIKRGIVHRLTGSILITFMDKDTYEK